MQVVQVDQRRLVGVVVRQIEVTDLGAEHGLSARRQEECRTVARAGSTAVGSTALSTRDHPNEPDYRAMIGDT